MKLRKVLVPFLVTLGVIAGTVGIVYAAASSINGTTYTHPGKYSGSSYNIFHGIDVSYWQGSISAANWTKVKKSGVDYAFIRCGYTSYNKFSNNKDSTFADNLSNAYSSGVNVGVYYWSEATTTTEAKNEAAYVVSLLKSSKAKITMPVVMDYEFADGYRSTTAYNKWVKSDGKAYARKRVMNNAIAFMNVIKAAGYTPMFYSYRGLVDPSFNSSGYKVNMSGINGSNQYKFWLAQYSSNNSYSGNFEFWQYTSGGSVSGLSGNIDRNFWYYNNSAVSTTSGTTSIKNCSISLSDSSILYTGSKIEPTVTVKDGTKTLTKGTDYLVLYLRNVNKGTAYVIIKGIGNYSNEALKTFTVASLSMDSSNTTANTINEQKYTGSAIKPSPIVKYNGTVLTKNTDYTLSYSNNKNVGTATVKISGAGAYAGTISQTFKITKSDPTISSKRTTYSTVSNVSSLSLGASTNGSSLSYSSTNNNIASVSGSGKVRTASSTGTATVIMQCPDNSNTFAGSKAVTVKVYSRPATAKTTKLKKYTRNYFKVYWKKISGASGYQIKYSKYSSFKSSKSVYAGSAKTTSKIAKDKYSGHYVYVKVRAYKTLDGTDYYGNYSTVRKVKVR